MVGGDEGVDVAELRPAEGIHRSGGVQLHGAGAQRDHAAVEAEVAVFEFLHVTHHVCLAAVLEEHRGLHELGGTLHLGRDAAELLAVRVADELFVLLAKGFGDDDTNLVDVFASGGLVEADAEVLFVDDAEVHAVFLGGFLHLAGAGTFWQFEQQRVEEVLVELLHAEFGQFGGQLAGEAVDMVCDLDQALRAMIEGVEARHDGQQCLSRADVGRGALTLDVLLAGLEGQTVGGIAEGVDADADDTAGHLTLVGLGGGEVTGMRTAESHRQAETLVGT